MPLYDCSVSTVESYRGGRSEDAEEESASPPLSLGALEDAWGSISFLAQQELVRTMFRPRRISLSELRKKSFDTTNGHIKVLPSLGDAEAEGANAPSTHFSRERISSGPTESLPEGSIILSISGISRKN